MDEEHAYRIYITDILKAHGEGATLTERWLSIITPKEQYDPEQIVDDLIARMEVDA